MEATIGFDLRSIVRDPSWTVDRRAGHLLRRDVAAVRSVDPFSWERPLGLPRSAEAEGLWPSLSDLFEAARGLDLADVVTVRITELEADEQTPESVDPVGSVGGEEILLG